MEKRFVLSNAMKFLIVDENESYRIGISNILKKLGFTEIHVSGTSTHAIKSLSTHPVDLIICERNMSDIDGAQILKEIRESFDIKGTPFLMMGSSNTITKEDLAMLADYEIDGFLTKPFTPATIIEKIRQCVEHFKNPSNFEYIISLAKHKLMTENTVDQALTMFERLLDAAPDSSRIRVYISRCYRSMNDLPKAIEYCKEAIEKNPSYAQSYDELGKIYLLQDIIEESINCFKNAISISPKYPPRYEYIVDTLIRKKYYAFAELIFQQALENEVVFDDFNLKYGEVLYHLQKQNKALVYLQKALVQNPHEKRILNLVGICLKDLGRGEDALKLYNSALKQYPTDTKIMFNKALCLISLARFEQSKKLLNLILKCEPNNQKVIEKLTEISSNN